MEKRNKKQKKAAPKRLTKKQLAKLQGGVIGKCSNVHCCSLGSRVPDGCTNQTAIIRL